MRPIDADTLIETIENHPTSVPCGVSLDISRGKMQMLKQVLDDIRNAPTVGGWISVKDDMPKEHNSIFANYTHLSKHMWAKESDNVIVYVRFPDGTGRSTEGRLQDGKWWTRISPTLEPTVTHWMPMPPEPPKEG